MENVVFVEFRPAQPVKTERELFLELIDECKRSRLELRRLLETISRLDGEKALAAVQVQK